MDIFIGKIASAVTTVNYLNTAKAVGSGSLDVFATPMLIALMERVACDCLADVLEPGQSSVGTKVCIEHTAASPVGAEIAATAVISGIDRRRIEFEVYAADAKGEVGWGTHERFVVDAEKFLTKTMDRK